MTTSEMTPHLTVVMPVKNAQPYLDAAVESILSQSLENFEFVIRDDASTDGTRDRLRYWAARDGRIRLFEGLKGLGPAGSSNWVVEQARTPIVARMDADDVARPDRLRRQLEILRHNPDAVLVGSLWEGIDRKDRVVRPPNLTVLGRSGFAAPLAHGSIMFRRESFEKAGKYRSECDFWEDLDLYQRMAQIGRILFTVSPLYQHRFSETSTRLTSGATRVEDSVELMFRCRQALERGEDYEYLVYAPRLPRRRLDPNTFLSLGSITLWSGVRPGTLQRLVKRGRLGFNLTSARALVWAAWAATSPRSLRFVMRQRLRIKHKNVLKQLAGQSVCEWKPQGITVLVPNDGS